MADLNRFGVSIDESLLISFDRLITGQGYGNRSEAIRDLIRDALIKSKVEDVSDTSDIIGSLTLVYDHHASGLLEEMTQIQHKFHSHILSVMHLHVSHDDCLEIIALRGQVKETVDLANSLLALKGIKNGKLFLTLPSSSITS
ncbi:MAG: nickel-responsive transcriptional regulator NikR [Pyrinomonadaceae bacterium]